jgi:hypothetical protein
LRCRSGVSIGKKGKQQIIYGLLCAADGCPLAIEVFEGNADAPSTLNKQIAKLKQRFGLEHVVMVGDRGMITQARIEEDLSPSGLDWITALRVPAIRRLVEGSRLQLTLFDQRDLASFTADEYPADRLPQSGPRRRARAQTRRSPPSHGT